MEEKNFKNLTITVSDNDGDVSKALWEDAVKHWRVIVYDKQNRKQMGFDFFGGSMAKADPLDCLYCILSDALSYMDAQDPFDFMSDFGYTDFKKGQRAYNGCKKAYFKCRKFIGADDEIVELANELNDEING